MRFGLFNMLLALSGAAVMWKSLAHGIALGSAHPLQVWPEPSWVGCLTEPGWDRAQLVAAMMAAEWSCSLRHCSPRGRLVSSYPHPP